MRNRRRANTRRKKSELRASGPGGRAPRTIPLAWLNFVIALFLLAPAWISTQTFFTCFRHAAVHHRFWASEEFWFFCMGVIMWVIVFFSLPRPLLVYVFGHELTHALWVWAMGGRVSAFRVTSAGGHIISDKHNFWIALAPYFFPLYSIVVIILYGIAALFWNLDPYPYHWCLYGLVGATWAFHVSFTLWMIPKGQTDLTYFGTFFSLVVIYIMNLAVLTALLIIASPHVTWRTFAIEWLRNAHGFSHWVLATARHARILLRQ